MNKKRSQSPIPSQKSVSSKSKNKASEKEIIGLIINKRTHSIFNAIGNTINLIENRDIFDNEQLDFIDINSKQFLSGNVKGEDPLKNSPSSFYRTVCLQLDILKTADKSKLVTVLDNEQMVQLIDIFETGAKCLSVKTFVSKVLLSQSKYLLYSSLIH